MKIKFLAIVILATVILSFGITAGTEAASVQELIAQIQAQIAQLTAQLKILQAQQKATQTWCHTFSKNLRIGDSGPEIDMLATALSKESLFSTARTYPDFDENIASAVSEFQEKYAPEVLSPSGLRRGTGYVGPATRKKLNALYRCDNASPGSATACKGNNCCVGNSGCASGYICTGSSQNPGYCVIE